MCYSNTGDTIFEPLTFLTPLHLGLCRLNTNVQFKLFHSRFMQPLKPTLRKTPRMNFFVFVCTVLLTSRCLWLLLLYWNGDRLTAGLLVVQKGPHFLCVSHSRFSPQTFTLTRLVFPHCFLSRSSPDCSGSWWGFLSLCLLLCPGICLDWLAPVRADSASRNEGTLWNSSNIKPQRASLDWLTSYYFMLYSTPCTFRLSWLYKWMHTHTHTHTARPVTQSRFLSGLK